jgi:hypothetical protein
LGQTKKILGELADGLITPKKNKDKEKEKGLADQRSLEMDKSILENINNKISSPTVETNIRIIASAKTEMGARSILGDLESAFNQFENTGSNKFAFKRLVGKEANRLFRQLESLDIPVSCHPTVSLTLPRMDTYLF